ncbi:protein kinase [Novymonas esmeraldas]|uniref:Protein kinase n=1 Tax=Novymonas esmeraldas TaxID=1808958 RepID=A0AAW0FAY4_9TRYP
MQVDSSTSPAAVAALPPLSLWRHWRGRRGGHGDVEGVGGSSASSQSQPSRPPVTTIVAVAALTAAAASVTYHTYQLLSRGGFLHRTHTTPRCHPPTGRREDASVNRAPIATATLAAALTTMTAGESEQRRAPGRAGAAAATAAASSAFDRAPPPPPPSPSAPPRVLLSNYYDLEPYTLQGIAGGAHGWKRVYGLLKPEAHRRAAPSDDVYGGGGRGAVAAAAEEEEAWRSLTCTYEGTYGTAGEYAAAVAAAAATAGPTSTSLSPAHEVPEELRLRRLDGAVRSDVTVYSSVSEQSAAQWYYGGRDLSSAIAASSSLASVGTELLGPPHDSLSSPAPAAPLLSLSGNTADVSPPLAPQHVSRLASRSVSSGSASSAVSIDSGSRRSASSATRPSDTTAATLTLAALATSQRSLQREISCLVATTAAARPAPSIASSAISAPRRRTTQASAAPSLRVSPPTTAVAHGGAGQRPRETSEVAAAAVQHESVGVFTEDRVQPERREATGTPHVVGSLSLSEAAPGLRVRVSPLLLPASDASVSDDAVDATSAAEEVELDMPVSPTTVARRRTIAEQLAALTSRREQQHRHTRQQRQQRQQQQQEQEQEQLLHRGVAAEGLRVDGKVGVGAAASHTDTAPGVYHAARLQLLHYENHVYSDVTTEVQQCKRRRRQQGCVADRSVGGDGGNDGMRVTAAAVSQLRHSRTGATSDAAAPPALADAAAGVASATLLAATHLPTHGVVSPAMAKHAPPSIERRVDDMTVSQQGSGAPSYRISLTYHDSKTGTSRTVNTSALPPLRRGDADPHIPGFSSAPSIAATAPGGVSRPQSHITRLSPTAVAAPETATLPSYGDVSVDSHHRRPGTVTAGVAAAAAAAAAAAPTATAATATTTKAMRNRSGSRSDDGDAGSSSTEFAAPLPPMEPQHGPRLQGVAGRNGEMAIGAFLGGGACGKVYECLNTETGQVLAAKQIVFDAKDKKLRTRLRQLELELEVLTLAARHRVRWVVGFYGAEKRGHSVLMYLEYCQRGSLLDYMVEGNSADAALWGVRTDTTASPTTTATPVRAQPRAALCGSDAGGGPSAATTVTEWQRQTAANSDGDDDDDAGDDDGAANCFVTNATLHGLREAHQDYSHTGGDGDGAGQPAAGSTAAASTTATASIAGSENFSGSAWDTMPLSEALQPQMPPLSIEQVQRFTRQIVEGLCFLHAHNYAHLDVKTANVLVTADEQCRLADLGCAMRLQAQPAPAPATGLHDAAAVAPYPVLVDRDAITELRGTALYMAPEIIRFESNAIGSPADVWSLGCVVMEMATGSAPWRHIAKDKLRVLYRIGSARGELPLPPLLRAWAEEGEEWLAQEGPGSRTPREDEAEEAAAGAAGSVTVDSGAAHALRRRTTAYPLKRAADDEDGGDGAADGAPQPVSRTLRRHRVEHSHRNWSSHLRCSSSSAIAAPSGSFDGAATVVDAEGKLRTSSSGELDTCGGTTAAHSSHSTTSAPSSAAPGTPAALSGLTRHRTTPAAPPSALAHVGLAAAESTTRRRAAAEDEEAEERLLRRQHRMVRLYVDLHSFVADCVKVRPEDRSSAAELLRHPFLEETWEEDVM